MSMSDEQIRKSEIALSAEQQWQFDADVATLKAYGEAHGLRQLEGRTKHGLDPSGMLAVPDSRAMTESIAERLETTVDAVEAFITELHTSGPWKNIEKLKDGGTTPEARFYLSLAGVCNEDAGNGYSPSQYLSDRLRVMNELGVLSNHDREEAQRLFEGNLKDRVYGLKEKEVVDVDGERIVIAAGDPFIGMAAEGFAGGISKTGKDEDPATMYFIGTANIDATSLERVGMVPAFAEVFDPESQSMKRVDIDSEEGRGGRVVFSEVAQLSQPLNERTGKLKRIAGGFYLAYHDKDLAKKLLSTEFKRRKE